jgi:osmoprotectant transport system permease protein
MKKFIVFIFSLLLVAMFFTGCPRQSDTIVVASKDYTEQDILGHVLTILISENTDLNVNLVPNLNSWIIYEAIKTGDVDLYIEYSGTIYGSFFGYTEIRSPDEVFEISRAGLLERDNIAYLNRIGFNNTYALAVRQDTAEQFNLRTISDLARVSNELILGGTMEFMNREDGIIGLRRVYGLNFRNELTVEGALRYTAIINDQIQVTNAFSTDGMLLRHELVVLEDDLEFFPPYQAAVSIRQDTFEKYPQLEDVLNRLIGTLDDDSMRSLNYRVDVLQESPEYVARNFLISAGLIR